MIEIDAGVVLAVIQGVLAAGVRAGTPILYAMLGEIVSERAGVVNLGADGAMLMGACAGFITAAHPGDPALGIVAAAAAGAAISLLHALMVVTLRANQIASGLALTFLSLGVTSFVGRPYVKVGIEGIPQGPLPFLSGIPFLGPIFFRHDLLVYGAYLMAPAIWFFLFHTRSGLVLRSVGENSDVAFSLGIKTRRVQYLAVAFGGMCAGLAGAPLPRLHPDLGGRDDERPGHHRGRPGDLLGVASLLGDRRGDPVRHHLRLSASAPSARDQLLPVFSRHASLSVHPGRAPGRDENAKTCDAGGNQEGV
jgi:branched-subunit amino acid ABC-type transport system permease component